MFPFYCLIHILKKHTDDENADFKFGSISKAFGFYVQIELCNNKCRES